MVHTVAAPHLPKTNGTDMENRRFNGISIALVIVAFVVAFLWATGQLQLSSFDGLEHKKVSVDCSTEGNDRYGTVTFYLQRPQGTDQRYTLEYFKIKLAGGDDRSRAIVAFNGRELFRKTFKDGQEVPAPPGTRTTGKRNSLEVTMGESPTLTCNVTRYFKG
jgi:hypothetical protein